MDHQTRPTRQDVPGANSATGVDDPVPDRDYGDDPSDVKREGMYERIERERAEHDWPEAFDDAVDELLSAFGVIEPDGDQAVRAHVADVEHDQDWGAAKVKIAIDNPNSGTVAAVCNEVADQGLTFDDVGRTMVVATASD